MEFLSACVNFMNLCELGCSKLVGCPAVRNFTSYYISLSSDKNGVDSTVG